MVTVKKYSVACKAEWDTFVKISKSPLFFFHRDFLEYHADRFIDASLVFYSDNKIIALLPASQQGDVLVSHGGLTYGGLIFDSRIRSAEIADVIVTMKEFALENGYKKIVYKAIPYIFHTQAAQEDIYFITNVLNGRLVRRDMSCAIYLRERLKLSKGRKWMLARARKNGLKVESSINWLDFHGLLSQVLLKYDAAPVHSAAELEYLHSKFPDNLMLKTVVVDQEVIAACLLFVFKKVVHTQYLATNEKGKELGALDFLVEECIAESQSAGFDYFSFGISTEKNGRYLNQGLIAQKEGFGARGLCVDFYEISLND